MNIFQLGVESALESLRSSASGLTSTEASRRRAEFGPNRIERAIRTPIAVRFLREFTHFFAVILWLAALLAFVADLGEPGQGMRTLGLAIVGVIAVNGLFSFWQEYRAEEAFLALQRLLPQEVTTLRDGAAARIPAEALVPGDIIFLEAGDNISADCRVIEAFALRVNNATVTGESEPVARNAGAVADGDILRSRNALLAGTTVVSGSARALVMATGMRTEFGRIARLAQATEEAPSPLQRELSTLSRVIAVLAFATGVVVFAIGESLGISRWANFVFAIGIIVANVPEGLLPTVTLAMAMGARRMSARNVLVRRLPSVEALGAATVICTDKTGTLTENRMAVRTLYRSGGFVDAATLSSGSGSWPARFLECARRCHDLKDTGRRGARWLGDPMEIALVEMATPFVPDEAPKIDEIPFDSERKRLFTVHRTANGPVLYAKGAFEMLLPSCRWVADAAGRRPLTRQDAEAFTQAQSSMAQKGLRVLALVHRDLPEPYDPARLEEDLVLDALVGLEDPPRPEVPAAIERCRLAGIRVVMVTGDHPQTAVAIGREIGLLSGSDPLVVTGDQVRRMSDAQMWAALEAPEVLFARVGADQKLRIVTTLQRHHSIVAATGDGVNDAPALRAADIGIAMGVSGTDVARQAADMVLLDDNFASIVRAVEEGRAVYDNIRKFLTYILTSNVPELVPYLAFAFFNVPLALTILQILAVDLGTDMVPALGLGAEKAEPGVMDRPPRPRDNRVLTPALLARAYLFLGGFEAVAAMAAFFFVLPGEGYVAATAACLGAIVVMQMVNVHLCRSDRESVFKSARRWNALIMAGMAIEVVLMLLIVYTPAGNTVFGTAPISAHAWLFMLPFAATMLVAEELRKGVVRAVVQ
ncbi:MAG: cation-transporting P-type ATPase [Gammaproteobacteria bacterium]|nr:cation-transporting P-type ATPase [Gammaproteobacteria bacterium]